MDFAVSENLQYVQHVRIAFTPTNIIISPLNLHKNIKKGGNFPRVHQFCVKYACALTEFSATWANRLCVQSELREKREWNLNAAQIGYAYKLSRMEFEYWVLQTQVFQNVAAHVIAFQLLFGWFSRVNT